MLFNSFQFLFGFLPVVLLAFHLARRWAGAGAALAVLVVGSLAFYGWWNPRYLVLLVGSALGNYWLGKRLMGMPDGTARWWLATAGVFANLAVLGAFKYAAFFASSVNAATGVLLPLPFLVLPLGISFFTFEQIAFLVEVYRRTVESVRLSRYLLFVTFFPHLIAGPIIAYRDFTEQLATPRGFLPPREIVFGAVLFTIGLAKKVLLADQAATYSDAAFVAPTVSFFEAWGGAVAFAFQIYFDFSGYSDMALGLAAWFGLKLPYNFDSPYKSRSIIEFWRRWHMTLSWFLREYLYVPLGGNRRGELMRYRNILIVMLLGGLWHGAAWMFVLWGGLHGMALVVAHLWRTLAQRMGLAGGLARSRAWSAATWLLTMAFVVFAWVPFRATSLEQVRSFWIAMVSLREMVLPPEYFERFAGLADVLRTLGIEIVDRGFAFEGMEQAVVLFALTLVVVLAPNSQQLALRVSARAVREDRGKAKLGVAAWSGAVAFGVLAGIAVVRMLSGSSTFVYFQF